MLSAVASLLGFPCLIGSLTLLGVVTSLVCSGLDYFSFQTFPDYRFPIPGFQSSFSFTRKNALKIHFSSS